MQIIVEVNNAKKLDLLIELLRSVEFVKNIRLADTPAPPISPKTKQSFFNQFYGSLNTGTNPDEIDQKLKALREERERDTF